MATQPLPPAAANQVYIKVSALEGGHLTLPEKLFVTDADPELRVTVPSLSFFLRHPTATIVFDLGLKRDLNAYEPAMHQHIASRQPIITSPDVAESLRAGGVDPTKDVDYVILSHVHWDHVGTPTDFPNSKFVVGSGTLHLLKHGAPHYPAEIFDAKMFPEGRTFEFPPAPNAKDKNTAAAVQLNLPWQSIADVFPNAIDFFGDGSLYVIDSPGHLYGHVNLLVRKSPKEWLYLGGDCCHDTRILNGEKGTALYDDGHGGQRSVHADTESAKITIERVQKLLAKDGENGITIESIIAHDHGWRKQNQHRFLPNFI